MIKKIILFISLFVLSLNATVLDTKISDANKSVMEALLKQIQSQKKTSADTALQKILIKKIESFDINYTINENFTKIVTKQQEYEKLFQNYISNMQEIFHTQELLKNIEHTLELLKNNIENSDAKEQSMLTLQLQYSYYKQKSLFCKNKIAVLQRVIDTQKELISNNIIKIKFDKELIENQIDETVASEIKIKRLITKMKIQVEKFYLLDDVTQTKELATKIKVQEKQLQSLFEIKLRKEFLDFSVMLQEKNKNVFTIHEKIKLLLKEMSVSEELKNNLFNFINSIESTHMGILTTISASTSQSILTSLASLLDILNKPLFSINKIQISSIKVIIAFLIFLLGFFIAGLYKRYIKHLSSKSTSISASTRTLLSNLGYYLIVVISFFISLNMLGINLSSITLVAGALSVGIGFGLQNIVSNFVSGVILMFEKSVKVDDYVELSDSLRGKIVDIRMRSTVINTNANIDVIVPNQNFIQNNVVNWTMNDNIKRFEIPFSVAYGTDINKVIVVVSNALDNCDFNDIYTSKERFTRVLMTDMGNSSVNFELFVWIKGSEILFPKRTTSRFLILIYNALNENNISIPFPQLDLHIKKD